MLHTKEELQFYQNLPLDIKIKKTKQRIREWYEYYNGDVYVSFSGGKDSTILLYLARQVYSDIPALYVDTGLEYPEIRQFVKTFDNVDIVRPKMRFDEVIKEYGYPVVSKEVSLSVYYVRQGGRTGVRCLKKFNDELEYNGKKSSYNIPQWKYLLDSDFKISHRCCDIMKKSPAKVYEKETNRKPIIGSLADESRIRTQKWIQNGCNAFNSKRPVSNPMSFWTEQDVLEYINKYQIPIASVYGEVVKDKNGKYKTTGVDRTGCVFCAFGSHIEKSPNRFEKMRETHPKQYNYCINGGEFINGFWQPNKQGLGMKRVFDYIGIKY